MATKTATRTFPALRLPALPIGYFWRVADMGMHMDQVQLRKKVLFFSIKKFSLALMFYNIEEAGGRRTSIRDPKTNIESAAVILNYAFTTGNHMGDAPYIPVEEIEIPRGTNLDKFETEFDAQYGAYRKDYK